MENRLRLLEHNKHAVVSSMVIAENFEKNHFHVIRDIETKIIGVADNSFTQSNFGLSSYNDPSGKSNKIYFMTRDGFSLLAMGFTGKKAMDWKVKYLEAFNRMEAFIKERQSTEWLVTRKQGKLVRRDETDSIALLIEYARNQGSKNMEKKAYGVYSKLVNSLVGIDSGQRDSVPFKTLSTIMFLEDMILHTVDEEMENGTYYKEIYRKCKANGKQIMKFAYFGLSTPFRTKFIRLYS